MSKKLYSLRDLKQYLKPGDFMLTTLEGSNLSKIIRFVEKTYSKDRAALYTHANIIIGINENNIKFLDTLMTVKITTSNDYANRPCAIFRIKNIDQKIIDDELKKLIKKDLGEKYPIFRLGIFLLKLADNIHWEKKVCSERIMYLIGNVLSRIGICKYSNDWYGWNPDMIYDECINDKDLFELIYEGHV